MSEDREPFLERWSRLKREAPEAKEKPPAPADAVPASAAAQAPATTALPKLPDIETLTPQSDFRPFMDPRVDPSLRRSALKRLFRDPRFNALEQFEAYSGDYTKEEPIPLEMLRTLNQARKLLFDEAQSTAQANADDPATPRAELANGAGKQDA